MKSILKLQDVSVVGSKNYRLNKINISIFPGEKIALLGQSGAGKSTLISVANGSIKADEGLVSFKGLKINTLKNRQLIQISTLWQDLRLIEELNVEQNINVGALGRRSFFWALRNLLGLINNKLCIDYLEAVHLSREILTTNVKDLSGGQKQRVAIARLLMQHSELMLADEPLSNLDPSLVDIIIKLLIQEGTFDFIQIPRTALISLHRPELIKNFSRVIGLKRGRVVVDLPIKDTTSEVISMIYK